jgi:hypothetical protein
MALSDACLEFMQATADAADVLAAAAHHDTAPDYPIDYGVEIDALRRACAAVRDRPYDPQSGAELLRLAASVMTYHDTPPDTPEALLREVELKKLVRLLEDAVQEDQRTTVSAVLENVVAETKFTSQAVERLKLILPKLGKSACDIVIKILSDIGSATAKKMLGL